ncbi:MAG: ABC transporter ATP-binding protein, partial [Bacilli bacterium]|nr:ABC transporter ATP-binding protein [Bacilli bacterium]
MIRLEKITKKYNERKVLNDLSINFREKEFVAILGPSGCGKSTLLNIISGVEKPDYGDLFLGDLNISKLNKKKQDYYRNNYISYIFQNYNLISYLNVLDNLIISSKLKGKDISKKEINNILCDLKIDKISKNNVKLLSGGEQQRTAIARSLTSEAKIILADEPTGALDSINSINIMEILKDLSKDKLVIMVTHNEKLARKYATRIIKMTDGKIINDNKLYRKINNNKYELKKNKLSLLNTIMMTFKNIKNKKI